MSLDPIAVIGMSGRFPGADGIARFWQNLSNGVESVTFFSHEGLARRGVAAALLHDPLYVKAGAILDGVDMFDADFFGFTPREAEITDPQHRIFLECAWEALEDSGYNPESYDGPIGVYVGAGLSTYLLHYLMRRPDVLRSVDALALQLGNNKDYVPLRVSYKLNLRGPSININTACSSSLVAVHMACQSLVDHQCDIALAGGVGIQVPQDLGYQYAPGGINSPDGHCRAFDARAQGTVSGNGVGIVILKRYSEAVADGDCIRAVILGSAVNNDGGNKVGFTAPSVEGQARVISEALAMAQVEPQTIGYVEAHGTGTALGDPIEVAALTEVFQSGASQSKFCALGSVKTNIGHLDEAAGVSGLIKAILALEHAKIPPSLHFEQPNPEIDFERSPFYVPTRLLAWDGCGAPRRAGVSSCGIGGTNAHVVLEEAPPAEQASASRSWQMLLLSARTETALEVMTVRLAAHLSATPGIRLADVAHTLLVGRKDFAHRRMVLCREPEEAVEVLRSRRPDHYRTARISSSERLVAFLFPGQGSQHPDMGRGLYQAEPVFREIVDRCAEQLTPLLGVDLRAVMYPEQSEAQSAAVRLEQTAITQSALFTVEYALAQLLIRWGIKPWAMSGHSVGEYVAACLAGVFSFEDALSLVAVRGMLMQRMPAGGMLAVELGEHEVLPFLREGLTLAVVNAPSLCVVAGAVPAVQALEDEVSARGIACRRLQTSHAFHSPFMDPVLNEFVRRVREIHLSAPTIPYLSNLTGRWITADEAVDPEYWAQHLRQTVRFSQSIQRLLRNETAVCLEVGPGQTLSTLVKRHPECGVERPVISTMRHPLDPREDGVCLLEAVGRLWLAGACPKPVGLHAPEKRRRVSLPTYPFERKRYWVDSPTEAGGDERPPGRAEDRVVTDWFYVPEWKRRANLPRRMRELANECWLVFLDSCGLGDRVAERMRAQGRRVLTVAADKAFARRTENSFTIDPARPDHYAQLFMQLAALDQVPRHVVHLLSVTKDQIDPARRWDQAQERGFYSLLFLVQAASRQGQIQGLSIHVVSSHMQNVVGGELSCPEKATLLGPVRVVPKEFPGTRCRSIDLIISESGGWDEESCLDRLIAELLSADFAAVTAIRADAVWEQTFLPRHLPSPVTVPTYLRAGGTYLITGGLGSMGLAVARWLAREVRAKLVLLGRTGLPPEASGDRRPGSDEPISGPPELAFASSPSAVVFDPERAVDLVERLRSSAATETILASVEADARLHGLLHAFCSALIGRYFGECGVALTKGSVYHIDELRARLNVQPPFAKFLSFLLRSLAEDGIVTTSADRIEVRKNLDPNALAEVRRALLSEYPAFYGLVRLLDHCAGQYRPALSREIPSIAVLYPDGTSALLDECSRGTPEYTSDQIYVKTAASVLEHIASELGSRTLRILEVGAGEGTLTHAVLRALEGRNIEYHFSDLGLSFVRRAQAEAAKRGIDFIRFGTLDISREPAAQGYDPHAFDVVLGYNVVHATPRIEATVGHLRRLLAPGGVLMLVETIRLHRWDEMVWGLTEGWWQFEDEALRTRSPLIALEDWERVLRRQGFDAVATFPREQAAKHASDAGLIVAREAGAQAAPRQAEAPVAATDVKARATIKAVQDIRALGGDVLVVAADVAEEAQMRAALSQACERFGPPHGIIHAAGVLGQGLISGKTTDAVKKVFSAKDVGILVLDKVLRERGIEPDFVVLCSSLASTAPIIGQVDYCAANAFLDAFAAYRMGRARTRVLSVDWGFWQELGMIEQASMPAAWKQRIADQIRQKGQSNAGIGAFRCLLESFPVPQVLVSPDRLDDLLAGVPADMPATAASNEQTHRLVDHPWFDARLVEGADVEAYVSHLDTRHWVLNEHRPMGKAVLPGTAFLELARAALATRHPGKPVQLSNVYFLSLLEVADDEKKEVRTILKKADAGFDFVVISRLGDDEWLEHARGEIDFLTTEPPLPQDIESLARRCRAAEIEIEPGAAGGERHAFVERVRNFPLHWRSIERVKLGSNAALATLRLASEFVRELDTMPLHPALADIATGYLSVLDESESGVPFRYKCVRLWRPLQARLHSHVRVVENREPSERTYDITILDTEGNVLVDIAGFTLRAFRDPRAHEPEEAAAPAGDRTFCVEIERPGSLDTLALRPVMRQKPGPGEVEIEVGVAGLNFIEVLYALGMLPEPPGENVRFGLECAGRIAAVGDGVDGLRPGDEVFGLVERSFSGFVTTSARAIARKPERLTREQAATLPAALTTAYYSLITRGRLRRGERILIHAASGGVGLAAVNIANWRGAEVFATAGTPEKREYLRRLGIRHVWDSRSLDFATQVAEATDGRGVDLVLNSLGGKFIPASLSVLARHGRFLELGKRDILADAALGLAPFEKHLAFIAIDVGTDLPEFDRVWRQVVRGIERQAFRPLPYRKFPIDRLVEAFEYMAQAKHIGKVVVAVAGAHPASVGRRHSRGRPLDDILGRPVPIAAATPSPGPTAYPVRGSKAGAAAARFDATHARPALSTPYRPPAGKTEQSIVDIWQELLGVRSIGVDDNFLELRGDSLLAAQVVSRLYSAFRVKLPLSSVFERPTAAGLASRIEEMRQSMHELATAPSSLPREGEVEQEL